MTIDSGTQMQANVWQIRFMLPRHWEDGSAIPAHNLPAAAVSLSDETTIREAILAAAAAAIPALSEQEMMRYQAGEGNLAFYRPEGAADARLLYNQADELIRLWGVNARGHLLLADMDGTTITLGDVRRAAAAGLIEGDITQPVVFTGGRGGVEDLLQYDWWSFFDHAEIAFGLVGATPAALKAVDGVRRRHIKKVAEQWAAGNITAPSDLRWFIAKKKEWTSRDVANLLDIAAEDAIKLLHALGYMKDPSSTVYRRDESEESKDQLEVWMEAEQAVPRAQEC
jgi:hypothetical protein